jgi:2-oxoisovalerate dehydrogenase E1 component alpha subunit
MRAWRARDPVVRFRNWVVAQGWWDEGREQLLRREARQQVGTCCLLLLG